MLHVQRLSPPAEVVPSVEELREHLHIFGTHEDNHLIRLRATAIEEVESNTGHAVGVNEFELTDTVRGVRSYPLPRYPYVPTQSESVLIDDAPVDEFYVDYGDTLYGVLRFNSPLSGLLTVRFSAGSDDPLVLGAVRLAVENLYDPSDLVAKRLRSLYSLLRVSP